MLDFPKVSVCIPLYNGVRYLEKTLDSVISQQDVVLDIVISDDDSSDGSLNIAEAYAAKYPSHNWKLLSSGSHLGMAANWNACIQASSGDFVKIMGQDDLIYPESLASQAYILQKNPTVSLVFCGCDIISVNGQKLFTRPRKRKSGIYPGSDIAMDCFKHRANLIGEPVTAMVRRTDLLAVGGFSPNQRYFIDLDLWLRLLAIGGCAVIHESECAFRIHGKAVSSSTQLSDFDQFDDLPGAREFLITLSPSERHFRMIKARLSTFIRSVIYRLFG